MTWLKAPCCCCSAVKSYPTLRPHGLQHTRPLSTTISLSLLKLMFIESVMPSNVNILCHTLLLPSIFPSIRVSSNESVLCIRWPKYWSFSFSISPYNVYILGWFLLGLTNLLSLLSKDSQESSPPPQFESVNSSALSLLHGPILRSILDCWKNRCFDYMGLCRQSDVFAC